MMDTRKTSRTYMAAKKLMLTNQDTKQNFQDIFSRRKKRTINHTKKLENWNFPQFSASSIFSIKLILEAIFKHLSIANLLCCRQVNSLWYLEASSFLLKNHITYLICTQQDINNTFYWTSDIFHSDDDSATSAAFTAISETAKIFPYNHFGVETNLLDNTEIQCFIKRHGVNIREFEIMSEYPNRSGPSINIIFNLLTKHLPKLEILNLQFLPLEWGSESVITRFKSVKLKSIRELFIQRIAHVESYNFVEGILNAAVNLKEVNCVDYVHYNRFMMALLSTNTGHLLKLCRCIFNSEYPMQKYLSNLEAIIVNLKPKLEMIAICLRDETPTLLLKLGEIISRGLLNAKDTLCRISDFKVFLQLPNFYLSSLPRITELDCSGMECNYFDFFEAKLNVFFHTNFVNCFPNLKIIRLGSNNNELRAEDEIFVCDCLKNVCPHLGVQKLLTFASDWSLSNISPLLYKYFGSKFPNLTQLYFPPTFCFLDASKIIWTSFSQLEILRLPIGRSRYLDQDSFPGIEAAFTGFSNLTCLDLIKKMDNIDCAWEDENKEPEPIRANLSILNLKKLRNLEIQFNSDGGWQGWDPNCPILTSVSGRFAFGLCPNLQVRIEVCQNGSGPKQWTEEINPFLGVKPYVKSVNVRVLF